MPFLPIDPSVTERGAIASLVNRLGEDQALPVSLEQGDDPFANFNIVSQAISISAAAKLNVGSIFTGGGGVNRKGFYYDAIAYTDKYRSDRTSGSAIVGTRWGIGLRVLLNVEDLEGNASLNFGLVSAAVQLHKANAQYEIVGLGLGLEGFTEVLGGFTKIGEFDYETYQTITQQIVPKVSALITKNKATLKPQAIAVDLTDAPDVVDDARSAFYAIHQIKDGKSRTIALSNPFFSAYIIGQVYDAVAPGSVGSTAPSREERDRAAQLWDI